MNRIIFSKILTFLLLGAFLFGVWLLYQKVTNSSKTIEINHNMVVEKIEALGKLETAKYYIKDVVEHTEHETWLPDPKVILILSGEVTGCIDLSKMDSTNIVFGDKIVEVRLPLPEICNYKINHQQSKVYDIRNGFLREAEIIDRAYKNSENQIKEAALRMNILDQTTTNAKQILKPLIEKLTNKQVEFVNSETVVIPKDMK
ncbi:MAG TPA: DUF4230 domain-containing protein [Cytophagaceae bacterium]|jgi:hypothetical protein